MNIPSTLALAGIHHEQLKAHLFPGDGFEAAAILLCSRSAPPRLRFIVREIILVPLEACRIRTPDAITWPGTYLELAVDHAAKENLSIFLVHSHPRGFFAFSSTDDESDAVVVPCLFDNLSQFHGSGIMTPDGAIRARRYDASINVSPIDLVTVSGHDLLYWWEEDVNDAHHRKRPIAFTSGMTTELGRLSATFIGVSGTGSINAEQGCRVGFGNVKLIDFDRMEVKNLGRILNSTREDATSQRLKVEMFADAVARYREGNIAEAIPLSISTRKAIEAASQTDVLFCNADSLEARFIADLIAAAFLIPLIDIGVTIPTRKSGSALAIGDVCGRIDYVQPGRSTLQDRGVYSPESLRAEYLRKHAPNAHQQELEAGYIKGLIDEAPAVISLNMRAASASMNEFIARAFPFRHDNNELCARTEFSLAAREEEFLSESAFSSKFHRSILGRGALEPLLGLPLLSPSLPNGAT